MAVELDEAIDKPGLPGSGQVWAKRTTGRLVRVVRLVVDATNPVLANIWVLYTPFSDIDGQWFIREGDDFLATYERKDTPGGAVLGKILEAA